MSFKRTEGVSTTHYVHTVPDRNDYLNSKESRLARVGMEWVRVGEYNDGQSAKANLRQWRNPWGVKYEFKAEGSEIFARLKG